MPPTIEIANLGMWDSLILMVMALVVFGPRRLPQLARQLGKLMYEFRKASNDFKYQMEEELRVSEDAERRKKDEEAMKALAQTAAPFTLEASSVATPVAEPVPSPYPYEDVYPALPETASVPVEASQAIAETPQILPADTIAPVAQEEHHG